MSSTSSSMNEPLAVLERSAMVGDTVRCSLLMVAGGYGEPGVLQHVLKVPQENLAMTLVLSRKIIHQSTKQFEARGALQLRYAELKSAMRRNSPR